MTLHIVLVTANRDSFVWITERNAFLGSGHGNFASIEKITHLKEHNVAFSGWGDIIALEALSHFVRFIDNGAISLDDDEAAKRTLRNFADDVLPPDRRQPGELKEARGLIVAKLEPTPRIYRVNIVFAPVVTLIYDQLNAVVGDPSNPANLFVRYYYPRCNKTIAELLKLGIHTMRLARVLNSAAIGETDAWVCKAGEFRQLGTEEVNHYERFSQSLDANI
jgi:hypothetical protein